MFSLMFIVLYHITKLYRLLYFVEEGHILWNVNVKLRRRSFKLLQSAVFPAVVFAKCVLRQWHGGPVGSCYEISTMLQAMIDLQYQLVLKKMRV